MTPADPTPVVASPADPSPVGPSSVNPSPAGPSSVKPSPPVEDAALAVRVPDGRAPRVGIMGGTFDPIHHGHLVAASEVADLFELDEVVFVPTGQPWQKADRQVSPAEHRYLMTVVATAANPRFWVSRVDLDRPGPTYTVDTVRDICAIRPGSELFFITGADALQAILSWKDAQDLFDMCHLIGVTRPGYHLSGDHLPADIVTLLDVPAMAISSSAVRERVLGNRPIWYLVPDGVVQYIGKHALYR